MSDELTCSVCTMADPLITDDGYECNICGHEWSAEPDDGIGAIYDVNGTLLASGDDIVVIKDLKLNGKTGGVKIGTKVKAIRLVSGDHPIQGKVDGRTILITADKVKKA